MQYIIENNDFKVTVDSKVCEVVSVLKKSDDTEYIWCGDASAWKRHTPVLFPVVGRYKNDCTIYDGKEYHMTQHGFARDSEFEVVEKSENAITMKLTYSQETLKKYPFKFNLYIRHIIEDDILSTEWHVENADDKDMYFSIGGHPAFVCGENACGAKLVFGTDKDILEYSLLSNDGLLEDKCYVMKLENKAVTITQDFFDKDAYIVENSTIKRVSLVKDDKTIVTVEFDTPVFGLWSPVGKGVPFVCIEPWNGRTDRADFDGDLTKREWSNKLAPGKEFVSGYKVRFGR